MALKAWYTFNVLLTFVTEELCHKCKRTHKFCVLYYYKGVQLPQCSTSVTGMCMGEVG